MTQHKELGIQYSFLQGEEKKGTLVFIHALGITSKMWEPVIPFLNKDFDILTYDLRGHGKTKGTGDQWSLDDFAGDLKGLLDHLGVKKCSLVGLSLGGMIAQTFALSHPYYLNSIVISNTTSGQTEASRGALFERAKLVESQGMEAVVESTLERWFTSDFYKSNPIVVDDVRNQLLNGDPLSFANATKAIAELDLWDKIKNIKTSTLVMTGQQDPGTNVETAIRIHSQIDGSQLEIIPNASHMATYEQPVKFADFIRNFLLQN